MHKNNPDSIQPLRWRVIAASVRGSSHEQMALPCQDANAWRVVSEDIIVAAVADGAGSARLSQVGATVAAQMAVKTIHSARSILKDADEDTMRLLLTNTFKAARAAVEMEAAILQVPARELATTLILIVATPDYVAAAQVGDGVAIAGDTAGNLIPLTTPQVGEYINETVFLITPGALANMQTRVWRGRTGCFAALSDGLQMLALNLQDNTPHPPFFTPFFHLTEQMTDKKHAEAQLANFLTSTRVRERADDDLTLLLAALAPEPARNGI